MFIAASHSDDFPMNIMFYSPFIRLMLAAFAGKTIICKELRVRGAKYSMQDNGGSTALHWAMHSENTELIQHMIDDEADLHLKDCNGWTPLLRLGECTTLSLAHSELELHMRVWPNLIRVCLIFTDWCVFSK